MTFWGATVGPCEAYTMMPTSPLHVTKAVLGTDETTGSARNVVQCRVGDADPVCVCSLRGNVEEQTSLDLVFEQGTQITFIASGPGTVHLTGYYVKHFVEDPDEEEDEEDEEEGEEEEEEEGEEEEDEKDKKTKKAETPAEGAKKRKREAEAKAEEAAPEAKKQCATPQRDSSAARKSVHFTDKEAEAAPSTPSTPQQQQPRKSHMQTPYNKGRQVPDTIVPSPIASKETKQPQKDSTKKDKGKKSEEAADSEKDKEHRTPEGLRYKDVRVGKGAVAKPGCRASVRYVGMLTNGKVFDRSRAPFSFKLGARQVIRGWDIGVSGMRVGGKRQLIIPPNLGYGSSGTGPIPPNATLVFDVELVAIH